MTRQIKHILKGVGSVLDIAPSTNYSRFVPKEPLDKRMQGHWKRTGRHLQHAINRFADEKEK